LNRDAPWKDARLIGYDAAEAPQGVAMHRIFSPTAQLALGFTLLAAGIGIVAAQDQPLALDVPYVPTPHDVVERMLTMADVKAGETVIDLGSGDGRIAIAAAKRGARALGVDLNPVRIREARENAAREGLGEDKVRFEQKNLFNTDISKTDVLTMYLLTSVNLQLQPVILKTMRPGARVVSHSFDLGKWTPDVSESVRGHRIFFWTVPAQIAGRWQAESGAERFLLEIKQEFQKFDGTAQVGTRRVILQNTRLSGADISFSVDLGKGLQTFRGKVDKGTITGESPAGWKAVKHAF
jgi:SAM-dependent methyltransferase